MKRDYPDRPIAGALAVVPRDGRVVLVARARPPNEGRWGFPGGVQELGETVVQAAERELMEETGILVRTPRIIGALDVLDRDAVRRIRHHYTLIVVRFEWMSGEGAAADDAGAVGWFSLADFATIDVLPDVERFTVAALSL